MKEEFLHFVWRTRNFDFHNLRTTAGGVIEVLDFGYLNSGGGPDFKQAKITIDGTTWAGNVEMHLASSDWHKHGHSTDPKYESVILHVVLEDDDPVIIQGRRLPCITLKERIPGHLLAAYRRLIHVGNWVACQPHLASVPLIKKESEIDRMLVARLEEKTQRIQALCRDTNNDWEEVLYRCVARAFGFGHNGLPFERLARLLSIRWISQQGRDAIAIEALHFGCAGFLNRIFIDTYPVLLQKTWLHLARKYNLGAMDSRAWEWGRVRPANFPTIRIAQLSAVLAEGQRMISRVLDARTIDELRMIFDVEASKYWKTHVDFDRSSGHAKKTLGQQSIDRILINSIVPFMFTYGQHKGDQAAVDRAIDMMHQISPEINRITKKWNALGMPNLTAGQSQGLLHLKRTRCDHYKCVQCGIGHHILLSQTSGDVR